jgi:hypothetical protein
MIGMASAIILLFLTVVFMFFRKAPDTFSVEYELSKLREKELVHEVELLENELVYYQSQQDSLREVITDQTKDIVAITKKYRYEKDRVRNLPLDDGVEFLSGWLSESDSI